MIKINNIPIAEWLRRHRRTIGIPLVLIALIISNYQGQYILLSLPLVCIGEAIRIWAAGHLQKEQILTTGGPYRVIRNPLYLGSFLIATGFACIAGSVWIWFLIVAYFLLCYLPVIRYEEKILNEKFPDTFPEYAKRVKPFYLSLIPFPYASTVFSWSQVRKNKEYNAVLGIFLVYALLILIKTVKFH